MSCVCPLINYTLATEENVKYESEHDAITFQLLEMSSINHPTKNNFEYSHKVHFSKVF